MFEFTDIAVLHGEVAELLVMLHQHDLRLGEQRFDERMTDDLSID